MRVSFLLPPPPHLAHLDFNIFQNCIGVDPAPRASHLHGLWYSLSSFASPPHPPRRMVISALYEAGVWDGQEKGMNSSLGYFQIVIINMLELK